MMKSSKVAFFFNSVYVNKKHQLNYYSHPWILCFSGS